MVSPNSSERKQKPICSIAKQNAIWSRSEIWSRTRAIFSQLFRPLVKCATQPEPRRTHTHITVRSVVNKETAELKVREKRLSWRACCRQRSGGLSRMRHRPPNRPWRPLTRADGRPPAAAAAVSAGPWPWQRPGRPGGLGGPARAPTATIWPLRRRLFLPSRPAGSFWSRVNTKRINSRDNTHAARLFLALYDSFVESSHARVSAGWEFFTRCSL